MTIPPEPVITEPAPAPEIFVEGFTSIGIGGDYFKFSMFSFVHTTPNSPPEQRIVARLTMPLGALVGMHQAMGQLLDRMKAQQPDEQKN